MRSIGDIMIPPDKEYDYPLINFFRRPLVATLGMMVLVVVQFVLYYVGENPLWVSLGMMAPPVFAYFHLIKKRIKKS